MMCCFVVDSVFVKSLLPIVSENRCDVVAVKNGVAVGVCRSAKAAAASFWRVFHEEACDLVD